MVPGRLLVGSKRRTAGTLDGARVDTVSMTVAVVTVELKVTLAGDTAQVLSDGKLAHWGTRVNVPVKPFIADSISDVLPDCPGLATVIDAGFAAIEKSGATTMVSVITPEEPEWLLSPRYFAVIVELPSRQCRSRKGRLAIGIEGQ